MKFNSFNLNKDLVQALNTLGYITPTKVQELIIPKALKKENLIVQSQTGSGKTHSYLIPIFNSLENNEFVQCIIVAPTRELARQIYSFSMEINQEYGNFKVKLFVSGEDSNKDLSSFKNGANLIIATPGKILNLISSSEIDFSKLKTIVLDEADMLIDNTFINEIDKFLSHFVDYQIMVFSATIDKKSENFLNKYIKNENFIFLDKENKTNTNVKHVFINTKHFDKKKCLLSLISQINPFLLLVFLNSKKETKEYYQFLQENGVNCGILSGDLDSRERRSMIKRVNKYEFKVVVCSDMASRGIDIVGVSDVINISIPNNIEYYFHRAGRCGRNNYQGTSYVFYDNENIQLPLKLIEQNLQVEFKKMTNDFNLVPDSPFKRENKKFVTKKDEELDKKIKINVNKVRSNKVKPGYKKKLKLIADRTKKQYFKQKGRKNAK